MLTQYFSLIIVKESICNHIKIILHVFTRIHRTSGTYHHPDDCPPFYDSPAYCPYQRPDQQV